MEVITPELENLLDELDKATKDGPFRARPIPIPEMNARVSGGKANLADPVRNGASASTWFEQEDDESGSSSEDRFVDDVTADVHGEESRPNMAAPPRNGASASDRFRPEEEESGSSTDEWLDRIQANMPSEGANRSSEVITPEMEILFDELDKVTEVSKARDAASSPSVPPWPRTGPPTGGAPRELVPVDDDSDLVSIPPKVASETARVRTLDRAESTIYASEKRPIVEDRSLPTARADQRESARMRVTNAFEEPVKPLALKNEEVRVVPQKQENKSLRHRLEAAFVPIYRTMSTWESPSRKREKAAMRAMFDD